MKYKKFMMLFIGIVVGIFASTIAIGITASAESLRKQNTDIAYKIARDNYDEYHIHPMVVVAILNGESKGNTAGTGKPFGMNGRRYYDTVEGTYAFLNLIRYNSWYGDSWKLDAWQSQLWAIEHHGYCTSTTVDEYMHYLYDIIDTYDLWEYEERFDRHLIKKEEKKKLKREREMRYWIRKGRQRGIYTIKYNPLIAPWEIIVDPDHICGGTVQVGSRLCEVVQTRKCIGYTIYCGDKNMLGGVQMRLGGVFEKAVG